MDDRAYAKILAKNITKDMTYLGIITSSTLEVGTGKSVFTQQIAEAYLEYVRSLPCTVCRMESLPHHEKIDKDSGGVGMKVSDLDCIPLCNTHHQELHSRGVQTFWNNRPFLDRLIIVIRTLTGIFEWREVL